MKCIKTARPGTFLDVSGLETPSSDYGKMSDTNVKDKRLAKHDICHVCILHKKTVVIICHKGDCSTFTVKDYITN